MKYRSAADIAAQVLATVNEHDEYGYGVTRTSIRYEVFLSSAQLKEYLTALTIHGLLSYNSTTLTYNATEKGLRFLNIYYKMDDLVNELKQQQKKQHQHQQPLLSPVSQQVQMWINRDGREEF
jgi:predicted transcriptional regulator